MPTQKLTPEIINAAILGFEEQKRHIDAQISELRAMLLGGLTEPVATTEVPKGKRRKMSAAARKRIGDAQRKRWAESKKPSEPQVAAAPKATKRKLSAAGRRAIAEATKKRWAAFHAAKAAEKPALAKKAAAKKAAVKSPVKVAAKKSPKKLAKAAGVPAVVAAR